MKKPAILSFLFVCVVLLGNATAAPIVGPNGHFYEYVAASGISWDAARQAADSSSYLGNRGHLATVFNHDENDIVFSLLTDVTGSVWLGGSDAEEEGVWRWVTNETFWIGGPDGTPGPDVTYANWRIGTEPNNLGPGENYLTIHGRLTALPELWNDLSPSTMGNDPTSMFFIAGYVVEYEYLLTILEPPSIFMFVFALPFLLLRRSYKLRRLQLSAAYDRARMPRCLPVD